MHKRGPWQVGYDFEVREYGWMEDYMAHTDVVFLTAVNPDGYRYIGPIIGNSRETMGGLEVLREMAEEEVKLLGDNFDPQDQDEWSPWFPVYGSRAYVDTNQDAFYLDAEKTDRPYYPADQ